MTACYSSTKSELLVVLGGSDITLSILINKETHKLSTSKIMLNHKFHAQSISCTAFDEGYMIMLDNDCTKLIYVAESFQIIRSIAAYPIDNIEYDKSRNIQREAATTTTSSINAEFIQQIPFNGESSPLLMTSSCIIQPDISLLFATSAIIFNTDSYGLIQTNIPIIKAFTLQQSQDQLGYIVIDDQNTICSVTTDIQSSLAYSSSGISDISSTFTDSEYSYVSHALFTKIC